MTVSHIWATPNTEQIILYIARVSNPKNQNSGNPKLIRYLLEHKHFSPFEMASWCVEIITSRAISAQICRHRSFHFQEFSQRYQKVDTESFIPYDARRQDLKNRQNSIDDLSETVKAEWLQLQEEHWNTTHRYYQWALDNGIAKECARMILPMSSKTRLYMVGTIRDWIFYILVRTEAETQKEHRDIANEIKALFIEQFPVISKGLGWTDE